jgi:hypothetical protein
MSTSLGLSYSVLLLTVSENVGSRPSRKNIKHNAVERSVKF